MNDISVAIADDQPLILAGLRMVVESQPDMRLVGEAGDGAQAVALARATSPDVMLMDVRMPGMDGIQATAGILAAGVTTRVLMLTTFDVDGYVYDSLRAGASGFLLKDTGPEQLIAGIHTVAAGDMLLAPVLTRRLIEGYVHRRRVVEGRPGPLAQLTDRERDVLRAIADGLSNVEIGRRLFVSEGTVKTHVSRILAKLGLRDRVQAVIAAYEYGLVEPGRPGA
ncbi:response regulator transcription factor [Microbacterium protaetiae]|uniref:Response regulator transcription factor n=1 Tax=Microbacterium protaetiae TaxID=2509458 RepID=A0A4P6EG33_9MICO|nr:response regulator transcription factor [Microbacterium protaetiae]QAY61362.1 response regulator transcription factor [Microbacterium protaetiae]